jgi:two-component system NtrC family response regulator
MELDIPESGIDLEELERSLIVKALEKSGGNVTRAARLLGLSRRTLQYRMEKMNGALDGAPSAPKGAGLP